MSLPGFLRSCLPPLRFQTPPDHRDCVRARFLATFARKPPGGRPFGFPDFPGLKLGALRPEVLTAALQEAIVRERVLNYALFGGGRHNLLQGFFHFPRTERALAPLPARSKPVPRYACYS